ncbi:hypothetical protein [Nocardia sp. NPDC051832]|uniref:hypothetical protein n=1 Tax=Nocardia sp. NPDC051832 TaxID=3155673 RepID=UPI003440FCE4
MGYAKSNSPERFAPDAYPVHAALPDLCTTIPPALLPDPALHPQTFDQNLDRNNSTCVFAPGDDEPVLGRIQVAVSRPGADTGDSAADRLIEVRRGYDEEKSGTRTPFAPVGGFGEEAKLAVATLEDFAYADLAVRDGVLLINIYVAMPGNDPLAPGDVAKGIAAELLRTLPQDGR